MHAAGLRFDNLPVKRVGLATALAAADEPGKLLTSAEHKALAAHAAPLPDLSLFVCCHGARDARCGERGLPLAAALQRLVRERGLGQQVAVYATSHIGGHKVGRGGAAFRRRWRYQGVPTDAA